VTKKNKEKSKDLKNPMIKTLMGILILGKDILLGLVIAILSLVLITCVYGFITYQNYAGEYKKAKPRSNSTQNVIYDKDGGKIYESFGAKEPDKIILQDIPDIVKQATLASEDLGFYNHGAIDPRGILRAAYDNYQNSEKTGINKISDLLEENYYTQGGSTITQQLIKNKYLTTEKSFDRKIKEVVYSYEMEKVSSKDKILEDYLNNVYYGEQALGISNAAKVYFDKSVKDLTLGEVSMLTGLPASPSTLSPVSGDYESAKIRQAYVLNQMYKAGYISENQAREAALESLYFAENNSKLIKVHPFYSDYVYEEAKKIIGENNIERGGYTIKTYLDVEKQKIAEDTALQYMTKFQNRKVTNGAVVILDNKETEITALVGGVDYEKSKVNVATSKRQPGSSFKPIVYLTGLIDGYSAATKLLDVSVNFGGNPPYIPKNYDGGYRGNITLRYALANSLNIPAVEMAKLVGVEKVIETAKILGISSINGDAQKYGLSIALGSAEVTPLELTRAYSVFANNGKLGNFSAIKEITDSEGNVIYKHQKLNEQVVDEKVAFIMSNILSDNQARTPVFGGNSPLILKDRKVAAKTGTTDDYADSWTMGFTPQYTVGVWMGNNDRSKMARISGIEGAAYIWNDVMKGIHQGLIPEDFEKPEGLSEVWVNPYSGLKSNNKSKPNILEIFVPGTEPEDKPDFSYLNQFLKK